MIIRFSIGGRGKLDVNPAEILPSKLQEMAKGSWAAEARVLRAFSV